MSTSSDQSFPVSTDCRPPPTLILIVDDDPSCRYLCRAALSREGYSPREAVDGVDALQKVREQKPDVIIMDALMPNMDGHTCTKILKADPETRNIPIIMTTALSSEQDIVAGLEAGADEYLTKPIRIREFVLRVRSMARLHHAMLDATRSNEIRGEQTRALTLLLDLSQRLAAAPNLDTMLEMVVSSASELTGSRRVSVMLPDRERRFLTIASSVGIEQSVVESTRVRIGGATSGHVFQTGQPIIINSAQQHERHEHRYDSDVFASVPLVSNALRSSDQIVGVLNITERPAGPFTLNDLEYIDLLCNIAASAINDMIGHRALEDAREGIVIALATLTEYRDDQTGLHLNRVMKFAVMLAQELATQESFSGQISSHFIHDLERAIPLHDVGKVAIRDHILLKPGRLTSSEMLEMRRHAEIGASAIRSVIERAPGASFLRMAEEIAWAHHEWYDGSGYPRGLKGAEIPLSARIASVADVYDALTTKRVYKDAMTPQEAAQIIEKGAGSQFDPQIVQAFLRRTDDFASIAEQMRDSEEAVSAGNLILT